jgi:hypothetical protein
MTKDNTAPTTERLRRPLPKVIDQRQQQIDPAGRHRQDRNARPDANRKQPGGSVDKADPGDEGPAS